MNYWEECVSEALDDVGIEATEEQIQTIALWVDGAHENYGTATGSEIVSANCISNEARELKRLKNEIDKKTAWELRTAPCQDCLTTGIVKDRWGRDTTCDRCGGKGRVAR